jgi:hypothetical protein
MALTQIKTDLIANSAVTQSKIDPNVELGGAAVTTSATAPSSPTPSTGDLWYNTTTGKLSVYYNAGWVVTQLDQQGIGSRVVDVFTATASQTVFTTSAGYSVGYVDVYVNGIKLLPADFTATNATTVTLGSGADVSDEVVIISWTLAPGVASFVSDIFTGNGSQTVYSLSTTPSHENQTTVVVDGVTQVRNTYSVSGAALTFSEAPGNGAVIEITTAKASGVLTTSYNDLTDKPDLTGLGIKISNIQVTDSGGTVLDDTAVDIAGGYIKLTGSGFLTGCQVLINNVPATSTTFVSSTVVRAQVPATAAGTYIVYLVNPDGGVGIRVNGVTFSATPSWVTGSALDGAADTAISIQLSATGASTFALQSGSTLPTGLTLSSGGLLSGTVTGLTEETVYSFTVIATDTENQDSPRTFNITISLADAYFRFNSLLLSANGTNNKNNNVFLDSSANNFTITRVGNSTQGSFSPYSPAGWSNYFDGSGDYLRKSGSGVLTASGDVTIECWMYPATSSVIGLFDGGPNEGSIIRNYPANKIAKAGSEGTGAVFTPIANQWQHFAVTFSSGNITVYINGTVSGTGTYTSGYAAGSNFDIGGINGTGDGAFSGYISNFRVTRSLVYTSTFTPPTSALTAIANTSLLTCQSNRFIDNSTNNYALTVVNDVKIFNFSPFKPSAAYDAATHGGSAYFDGTGDYLTVPDNAAFDSLTDFTIECWVYFNSVASGCIFDKGWANVNYGSYMMVLLGGELRFYGSTDGGNWNLASAAVVLAAPKTGRWYHIAVTRSGTELKTFADGAVVTSITTTSAATTNNAVVLSIGADGSGTHTFNGYISNFRLIKGTALYTSAFTPPTSPVTAVTNTSLLCNFANAGIFDATTKTILETVGDAKISTVQSKFGGSSMVFDGTGDYVAIKSFYPFNYGSRDYTIEAWVYKATSGSQTLFASNTGGGLITFPDAAKLTWNIGGTAVISDPDNFPLNQWVHVAVTRASGTLRLFVNGTSKASAANSTTPSNDILSIGIWVDLSSFAFNGYIDDLRITNGYARYTANFTTPTSAHQLR